MRPGTFVLLWLVAGKGVFPIDYIFLCHIQPLQFFLSAFRFCVWMSGCCLLSLLHLHLPVSCLISGPAVLPFMQLTFCCIVAFFFFFFVLPSPACVWALCSRPFRLLRDGGWQGVKKEEDRYMPRSMEGKKTLPPCRSILCGLLLLLIPFSFHLEVNVLPMGDLHICCFS